MFKIESNVDNLIPRLDRMDQQIHSNLERVVEDLKGQLVDNVKAKTPVRTGALRASVTGEVRSGSTGVTAEVGANPTGSDSKGSRRSFYAIWVEYGAKIPPHKIVPSVAKVLAFQAGGKTVFAKAVLTKPAILKAQQPIHGAFKEMRKQILSDLRNAVDSAL
ncbi:HK97 gp10 family phage protein [Methylocystis sp. MJC1]|uniref:HK97 gp10 family phage protein n=1 Tax=Methylocystis sp. MJC1 TaxID=2654282 RepID=UPI0013ECC23E|nr:HK97 gp10 family phage protein [Methylocystis sp. MJC1]KAF2991154.1 hypothetical protein MJC1_01887 [Methylocystis sp. MJC1]MBU6525923.1 HK97 gp10 family phage protein [Methylocystis sp. MJC1]UZX12389.1 HK97 gp10 family phage protein [Methylocystis sp. MJC1]